MSTTIADLKRSSLATLGYTGPIVDTYRAFLMVQLGVTSGQVNDLEDRYLTGSGTLNDKWRQHLDLHGITNLDLNDAAHTYWSTVGAAGLVLPYLFSNNEKGIWYDPSDLSSMFQDSGGTTAAVVGQPVGLIQDKSGNGFNATQVTSTARPILARHPIGGRRNLLTYTEDFSNAAWATTGSGTGSVAVKTPNFGIAPDGSQTACRIQLALNGGTTTSDRSLVSQTVSGVTTEAFVRSIWIKSNTVSNYNLTLEESSGGGAVTAGQIWTRVNVNPAVGTGTFDIALRGTITTSDSADILVWHPQLDNSTSLTNYQKVVSTYDVTEAGVNNAYHLKFDGIDDFMVTPSIDFSGTDKMSVFAGVRKLSDAVQGTIANLTTTGDGIFIIYTAVGATANYYIRNRGTTSVNRTISTYIAPITNVITVEGDIAAPLTRTRINGTVVDSASTSLGTGNYGNYPLYIGQADGTSSSFNGHLYSLVVRGALSDAAQISAAEAYVNSKTGAY